MPLHTPGISWKALLLSCRKSAELPDPEFQSDKQILFYSVTIL